MLACRQVGSPELTALAWAERATVFGVTDKPVCGNSDTCSGNVVQVILNYSSAHYENYLHIYYAVSFLKLIVARVIYYPFRASKNFQGCLPQSWHNLGQLERFSPGQNGSEVGRQITLNGLAGHPTSEPFGPGENLSNQPEIARTVRILPKFFSDDWGRQPRKFSRALVNFSPPRWQRLINSVPSFWWLNWLWMSILRGQGRPSLTSTLSCTRLLPKLQRNNDTVNEA